MLIALQRSSENDDIRLSTDKESAAHVCANQLCTLTHLPKALSADTGKRRILKDFYLLEIEHEKNSKNDTRETIESWNLFRSFHFRKILFSLVRVRFELTTLALSAPRSTDWANGPNKIK